jgi:large subunit ribosomal protein L14e
MFKIGTVCMKIAGRDAGNLCVIIGEPKDGRVLVDGGVRRKAYSMRHLEPTDKSVSVKANASHEEVMRALGMEPRQKATGKQAAGERPRTVRSQKKAVEKAPMEKKPVKAAPKKAAAPKAERPAKEEKKKEKEE